jgi:heat-inducible transcriptional repressor
MSGILLPDRASLLMKLLVDRYIREGQPVGSKTLQEESGLAISTATIRNVMADLEDRGLIRSPHTSAGRIPTAHGLRFFVDTLIQVRPVDEKLVREIQGELNPDKSPKELVSTASQLIADFTAQAGLVTVPKQSTAPFRMVEFLSLSDNRVLVILVLNEKDVQNRVIHTSRPFEDGELRELANYINQRFAGQSLELIRNELLATLDSDRQHIDNYLRKNIELANQAFEPEKTDDAPYMLTGESRLIDGASDLNKLKELFEAFQHKRNLLELVDRCVRAQGVQIFIGEESGYQVFDDYSVIASSYQAGQSMGVLGVIGPTRMSYEKVIPMVEVTARMLSAALAKTLR